jgi:hypothetical protein
MDAAAQLALLVKARSVFETQDTFLSVPVAPLPFTRRQLDFYAQGTAAELSASLTHLQAFSRLVNMIPSGMTWAPADTTLWDVYRTILQGTFAESTRTADEEADYQQAVAYLRQTRDDGTWEDSAVVKEYKQHKDAWLVAQQRFAALRASAEASTDPAAREQWRTVDEPRERAALDTIEQAWTLEGHRNEVESAQARLASLGGRSPLQVWTEWNARFNADIDALHGAMFQGDVFPSAFAPTNAVDEGAWLPFTLTETEITRLTAEAPAELRAKLDTDGPTTLKSLAFEFSSATIVRPWFSPDVFRARFWRLPDGAPVISDGATPPSGVCPAYVTAVVFARHIREEHKSGDTTSGTRFDGFKFVSGRAAAFDHVAASPAVRDHRAPDADVSGFSRTSSHAVAEAPHTLGRRRMVGGLRAGITAPRAAVADARGLRAAVVAAPPAVAAAPVATPVAATPVSGAKLRALREMTFTRLPVATAPPPATNPGTPQSEEIYVLAFICKRVGKCPDPDPTLTW